MVNNCSRFKITASQQEFEIAESLRKPSPSQNVVWSSSIIKREFSTTNHNVNESTKSKDVARQAWLETAGLLSDVPDYRVAHIAWTKPNNQLLIGFSFEKHF